VIPLRFVRASRFAALGVVLVLAGEAAAQDGGVSPVVTVVVNASGEARISGEPARSNVPLIDQSVSLAEGDELMFYSRAGRAALVARGPAQLEVYLRGADSVAVELISGSLMATSRLPQGRQPLYVLMRDANGALLVEAALAPGLSTFSRKAELIAVGYESPDDPSAVMSLLYSTEKLNVPAGRQWTLRGDRTEIDGFAPRDLEAEGQALGVAGARSERLQVEDGLFSNVIDWDKRSQAAAVRPVLQQVTFRAEIRQVAFAVSPVIAVAGSAGAPTSTLSFGGANTVPVLSPAASSVGGVSAVTNINRRAVGLLTSSGSRGLGFGGLSLLSIPGFQGGNRTTGPSGLAGTR
jgi:hypothetical protein